MLKWGKIWIKFCLWVISTIEPKSKLDESKTSLSGRVLGFFMQSHEHFIENCIPSEKIIAVLPLERPS